MLSKTSKAGSTAYRTVTGFSVAGLEFTGEEYDSLMEEMEIYVHDVSGQSDITEVQLQAAKKNVIYDPEYNTLPEVTISIPVALYCNVEEEYYAEIWVVKIDAATGEWIPGEGGFTNF